MLTKCSVHAKILFARESASIYVVILYIKGVNYVSGS